MRNPIIVALDLHSPEHALRLAERLAPVAGGFKVGKELFVRGGLEVIRSLRTMGIGVFLDLKFHDIPNTVAGAVAASLELDIQMLTVHTSGGPLMLETAETTAQETAAFLRKEPPLILGVTVLTSLGEPDLRQVGVEGDIPGQVERLARLAVAAGLRGLVCSPLEIGLLRRALPKEIQLVAPGIRPEASAQDDQKRTLTPAEAIRAGADWLVIGRPIIAAPEPETVAQEILASISC